jgi:hypothetical protein
MLALFFDRKLSRHAADCSIAGSNKRETDRNNNEAGRSNGGDEIYEILAARSEVYFSTWNNRSFVSLSLLNVLYLGRSTRMDLESLLLPRV